MRLNDFENASQGRAVLIGGPKSVTFVAGGKEFFELSAAGVLTPLNSGSISGVTIAGATFTTATLTAPSITTPTITSPVITGDAGSGVVYSKTVLFTEDATSLTHTGTVVVPAGATLLDIIVVPQVLWTATTSASLSVGDANSATGWFQATNLKATDLVLGERLQASQAVATDGSYGGAKEGAYVTTQGRFGQQSTNMIGGYCPTAYSVIGVVTVVDPATTAGRTRMTVLWTMGQTVAPVLA